MKVVFEDAWFPCGTKIVISAGQDDLAFFRCTFEGGEIAVDPMVDRRIFALCLFHGTVFSGQSLSERIASECQWIAPATESAA
jgi:hypothetical protein